MLPKNINTKATQYGKNEPVAVEAYISYQQKHGVNMKIQYCGLYVDSSEPLLAASPDAIVTDLTWVGQDRGQMFSNI